MKSSEAYKGSIYEKADKAALKKANRKRMLISVSTVTICVTLVIFAAAFFPDSAKSPLIPENSTQSSTEKPSIINPTDGNKASSSSPAKSSSAESDNLPTSPNPAPSQAPYIPRFQTATMNIITGTGSGCLLHFDPQKTYKEVWTWDKIVSYLGCDITPAYIMPGLKMNVKQNTQTVIFNNDGTLAYDAIWLEYYTEYEDDGSQSIGFNSTGIRIIASRLGYSRDCVYIWPSEPNETLIGGVSVMLGNQSMDFGGTAENPEGYYDIYVAEFTKDGISYQVTSSNIDENEFVKMVTSLVS